MPITTQWDDMDKTVIRFDFVGEWSWDEFYALSDRGLKTLGGRVVPLILDMTRSKGGTPYPLENAKRGVRRAPEGMVIVLVTQSAVIRVFVNLLQAVYRHKNMSLFTVKTLDEARALVAKHRIDK